jgi:signal transduction histidine kinase
LTALRDIETFDNALLAGCDDFLTKPVRPSELLAHVRAALKLRQLSTQLREHCSLLREQRDQLMRLQLQKERLMSFVVHDLKNPVNSMDLHAQLILRNRELPEAARASVEHIRDEARNLQRLVLNLLDISKSEEGQLVPRVVAVDLLALVHTVLDNAEVSARNRGVTLEHDLRVTTLPADPDLLLRRVLENLIDNALRHAPSGSAVYISTRCVGSQAVELRVADAGAGIAVELRERVFERFLQLEHGDHALPSCGRGLGLAFCKLAIDAHGGTIHVEDAAPGAAFCIQLPSRALGHAVVSARA